MYRPRQQLTALPRPGVILLVVIVLLTIFALVGIAFVFYTSSEATSSRIFREAQTVDSTDESADALLRFFLGQYIYDQNDSDGVYSSMRGHSLSRTIYGYNHDDNNALTIGTNINPFDGVGRLHYTHKEPIITGQDDFNLVNYMYYQSIDGFLRDPERLGIRANAQQPVTAATNPYTGGFNAPYTYPDLNNMQLGAVQADGTVLMQSFFRPWNGFGSLDPTNPNWLSPGAAKYQVLRPRPIDQLLTGETWPPNRPYFPPPVSAGGDVKNLLGSPGTLVNGTLYNEDSIWMDLGYPVKQAPDGSLYKPLFAALTMDLDNRVNVNVHGNIRAPGVQSPHGSNQGWGKWEVNLGQVLSQPASSGNAEWPNLFLGIPNPQTSGRYGANQTIDNPMLGPTLIPGIAPFFYAQLDYDGANENNGQATSPFVLPGQGTWAPYRCFPFYDNNGGWGNANQAERTQHPALFDYYLAANNAEGDDRVFDVSNMKKLLYNMGADALSSDLGLLCPNNFVNSPGSLRTRNLVTTNSFDLDRPGATPWVWDPAQPATAYTLNPAATGLLYPTGGAVNGGAISFPSLATAPAFPPPPSGSEFAPDPSGNLPDWRGANAGLGNVDLTRALPPRVDLNRALPPFPTPDATGRITDAAGFLAAMQARQQLAADIFLRLVKVTGAFNLTDKNAPLPNQQQFDALRWLAQLAANIVDYRDEDDVMTPFNWTALAANQTTWTPPAVATLDPSGKGWVFGTELPRAVVNEAYVEYTNDPTDPGLKAAPKKATMYDMNVYLELHNPFSTDKNLTNSGAAQLEVPESVPKKGDNYPVYQVVLTQKNANLRTAGNVLGDPDSGPPSTVYNTTLIPTTPPTLAGAYDFSGSATTMMILPSDGAYSGADGQNVGFYMLTPPAATAPFPGTVAGKGPPTPTMQSPTMSYQVVAGVNPPPKPTVLLRRLAIPYLPPNPNPGPTYNPYVTVDYAEDVPIYQAATVDVAGNDTSTPIGQRHSWGRMEPYTADNTAGKSQWRLQIPNPPPAGQPQHTLFRHNAVEGAAPPAANTAGQTLRVPFDWLVQPDRQLTSPLELLQVSGFKPHELTQQFMVGTQIFAHRAPWLDQTSRLYRALEYLECHDRASGMTPGGRQPGKININTIYDPETFMALCDPQNANGNSFAAADVQAIYNKMIQLRTPTPSTVGTTTYHIPGPTGGVPAVTNDQPFWSLAAPFSAGKAGNDAQYPNGFGINNTFLRDDGTGKGVLLFQTSPPPPVVPSNPAKPAWPNPYVQDQLMTKIFNNVTTRSNVFAVFLTVGFFQVIDNTTSPPKLGPEVGTATNQNVRHRMFAIVDRSTLALAPQLATGLNMQPPQLTNNQPTQMTVTVDNMSGTTSNNVPWQIAQGSTLVVDSGANQETVVVTAVNGNKFQATFIRNHPANFGITIPGNPGPQPGFDQHNQSYAQVVPYFVILQ
ncbi:MAG TPA: hypothetical protein VG013_06020 [Gemmataceae bacterium]|nr:hypothetical protein [Gemmataceae bacterium]